MLNPLEALYKPYADRFWQRRVETRALLKGYFWRSARAAVQPDRPSEERLG